MCPGCCQPGGSLLHCPSTLTRRMNRQAVHFCCTVPGVASARRYLAPCPVKPGLSSPALLRNRSSGHLFYSHFPTLAQIGRFVKRLSIGFPPVSSGFGGLKFPRLKFPRPQFGWLKFGRLMQRDERRVCINIRFSDFFCSCFADRFRILRAAAGFI